MEKTQRFDRKLVFENGREFLGAGFGSPREALCQCSFDTAMIGYQEILSDPACAGEALVMTYPVIGSYGMADEDYESRACYAGCLIVRRYNDRPSNFRYTKTVGEVLEEWTAWRTDCVKRRVYFVLNKKQDLLDDCGYTFKVENKTADKTILFMAEYGTFSIDNQMVDFTLTETVKPGMFVETFGYFDNTKVTDIDAMKNVAGTISLMDNDTYDAIASYPIEIA